MFNDKTDAYDLAQEKQRINLTDQAQCATNAIQGDYSEYRLNRIRDRIRYHAPSAEQVRRYQNLRDGCLAFATIIVRNSPSSPDADQALNLLENVLMLANKSIALEHCPL